MSNGERWLTLSRMSHNVALLKEAALSRTSVVPTPKFAAWRAKGRLLRCIEARNYAAPPRGNFCECAQQTFDGSAQGSFLTFAALTTNDRCR